MNRLRDLVANPWRQHRFLAVWTWMYLLWAIVPVFIAIAFSFNASRSRSAWQGLSLRWWTGDPDLSLLHNPVLTGAIRQSLVLAALTMVIATPIGIALALGLARWRGRGIAARRSSTRTNASTESGSKIFPELAFRYASASLGRQARRYGRSDVSASHWSTIANSRAGNGIS